MTQTSQPRLLVFGSREWQDIEVVRREVQRRAPSCVISGCARGADTLGEWVAEELGVPVTRFPAEWSKYGRAAGPIRNQQMLDEGKPDEAIGFHEDLSKSKGTKDMVRRLKRAGIPYEVYDQ